MLNHIDVMGRFVADPEVKYTGNQNAVVSFRIANDDDFTPQGQEKKTSFVDCVAWRKTAEHIGKYYRKGSMAIVSGRLTYREWEKDGQKHRVAEVNVENIYFGSSKSSQESAPAEPIFEEVTTDDIDLPF